MHKRHTPSAATHTAGRALFDAQNSHKLLAKRLREIDKANVKELAKLQSKAKQIKQNYQLEAQA